MRSRAFATCWMLAWSTCCTAELLPMAENDSISVQIRGLQAPDTLRQDLVSGLTNRILIRMTLLDAGQAAARSVMSIGIKYDLWEESFRVTTSLDGRDLPVRTLARIEEVLALLADLPAKEIFRSTNLQRGRTYTLQAEVLFDPIDRERMDKIRLWVAQNSNFPSTDTPGASPSAGLFNRIFEQYAAGADVASVWRQSMVSRLFRPEELPAQAPAR